MRYLTPITIMFLTIIPASAHANMDSGLYDPVPPEGSAFVRFLSDRNTTGSIEAKANNKGYDYLNYKDVSSYYVVPKGNVESVIGDTKTTFQAEPGKFYTVILNDTNTLEVKTDPQNDNQAKSQILFYNLSNTDKLALKTTDGKIEVVPSLEAGGTGEKQINPVKVSLAIYNGDKIVKDLGEISLERAKSYTVVALDNNEAKWVQSSTNTTR